MFLSYDVRGIQKFIFAVPNLRCIIGASSLIAEFDASVDTKFSDNVIYAGGGSGMLNIDTAKLEEIKMYLLDAARKIGADLRIGTGVTFSDAKTNDELFPFVPASFSGEPCAMSGLFPVEKGKGAGPKKDIHPLVWKRQQASNSDAINEKLLSQVRTAADTILKTDGKSIRESLALSFFRNVNSTAAREEDRRYNDQVGYIKQLNDAIAGASSLGNRNRWAVIAMDGNDAGQQHMMAQHLVDGKIDGEQWTTEFRDQWVQKMSSVLVSATNRSFVEAAAEVVAEWYKDNQASDQLKNCCVQDGDTERLVLPIRPLIIGGDDVILLCHHKYAFTFVKRMANAFTRHCHLAAEAWSGQGTLWPASGNQLTMSAGILFTKNSYPLHGAIQYAENLLGSAKGKYRVGLGEGKPTPAAVDWDIVTDSLLDTPAARRNRELIFDDRDIDEQVVLTRRPYLLAPLNETMGFTELELLAKELEDIPNSLRASIMVNLKKPWADRVQFFASLSRKQTRLFQRMQEETRDPGNGWQRSSNDQKTQRSTDLLDALLLLEETRRTDQRTLQS